MKDSHFGRLRPLLALLAAGLMMQLVLAACTDGYPYDIGCFMAWALRMADGGAAGFYMDGYFCDYPPGYLWVLGLVGRAMRHFSLYYEDAAARILLTLVPSLCGCGLAALVWRIAARFQNDRLAIRLAACALFCPVLLFDTAVWKQIDGVFSLLMVGCFWLLSEKKYLWGAVLYGLALAVKPQALLAGPVLAAVFLVQLLEKDKVGHIRNGLLGAVCALGTVLLVSMPFYGSLVLPALLEQYGETSASYPYAVINAFNLAGGLGGNWLPQNLRFGPLTWQTWGVLLLVLLTAAMAALAVASWRKGIFCPLLLAAFYTVGVFTLSHRMHERYIIFGILLTLAAAAKWGDRRLLLAAAGLSLTSLVNLVQVYSYAGTEDEFMMGALPALVIRIGGLAETACFILLAWAAAELLLGHEPQSIVLREPAPPALPLPQPRWTGREKVRLAVLTLATLAVSLWGLGDLTAPKTGMTVYGVDTIPVTTESPASELWVYPGINYGSGEVLVRDAATGTLLGQTTLNYGNPFCWQRMLLPANTGSYELVLSDCTALEFSFRDESGAAMKPQGVEGSRLFDEASKVPEIVSYRNSTYFDEIYHARTAYELGHRMPVYETTHPPLGKDIIWLGILLFGMTGFGWRVMGALFGAAMVPVFYLLARRLTRSPRMALLGAVLLALDGLRFVQTRVATIDVYATFFILLSAYFMVWYAQTALARGVHHALLPMALCGVAFGLGCASKWTGIYAGAGLAILFFWVLWARWRQGMPSIAHEAVLAVAGGVLFFVAVPLAIYLLSYLPYWLRQPDFSLADWWNCQLSMYRYHSQLEASHPFESRWYTWPLTLRPVWYYAGSAAEGLRSTIAAVGNPVVWWGGTAGLTLLAGRQLTGRGDRSGAAVLVLWLVQVLPWLLVSRCTFLYHYFPGFIFALMALVMMLESFQRKNAKAARATSIALAVGAAVCFGLFYPVLSGIAVPAGWVEWLQWLPTWGW